MYGTNTVRRTYSVQHTIVHCTVRTTQAQTSVEIMDSKVTTCTLHGVYSVLYTYSMLHDDMYIIHSINQTVYEDLAFLFCSKMNYARL